MKNWKQAPFCDWLVELARLYETQFPNSCYMADVNRWRQQYDRVLTPEQAMAEFSAANDD